VQTLVLLYNQITSLAKDTFEGIANLFYLHPANNSGALCACLVHACHSVASWRFLGCVMNVRTNVAGVHSELMGSRREPAQRLKAAQHRDSKHDCTLCALSGAHTSPAKHPLR